MRKMKQEKTEDEHRPVGLSAMNRREARKRKVVCAHTLTHSCTHTLRHTLLHTHSDTLTHMHSHSRSQTHSHITHAHMLTHPHTHSHTRIHTHTLTHTHRDCAAICVLCPQRAPGLVPRACPQGFSCRGPGMEEPSPDLEKGGLAGASLSGEEGKEGPWQ